MHRDLWILLRLLFGKKESGRLKRCFILCEPVINRLFEPCCDEKENVLAFSLVCVRMYLCSRAMSCRCCRYVAGISRRYGRRAREDVLAQSGGIGEVGPPVEAASLVTGVPSRSPTVNTTRPLKDPH